MARLPSNCPGGDSPPGAMDLGCAAGAFENLALLTTKNPTSRASNLDPTIFIAHPEFRLSSHEGKIATYTYANLSVEAYLHKKETPDWADDVDAYAISIL